MTRLINFQKHVLDPVWLFDDQVDSDVLFRSQKLILTFSEIWQSGNLKACETYTVNF